DEEVRSGKEVCQDVLSRPHPMPVSQECLATLKTDDRLVTILRHQNFLKEMQEIAAQGESRITHLVYVCMKIRMMEGSSDSFSFKVVGGELIRLQQQKIIKINLILFIFPDDESDEKRDACRRKSKDETSDEEEEMTKRLSLFHKNKGKEEGRKEETKQGNRESLQRWTKATKPLLLKKKAATKEEQHEVPHHSKEIAEEKEEEKKRNAQKSPEEKELQMIARRAPEERRGLEEEGSASRKSEEPEIESLAAIESELENVAQKLHELRRG
uniref:Chromogranin-A n=1 Tax=Pundamilia nyererei TaxID=303518 RepID=A0A3B4F3B7_9CICH